MTVLYIVLPLALILVSIAVISFVIAARRGQFDDLDTPARRMLIDEQRHRHPGPPHAHRRVASSTPRPAACRIDE
jgi:cbb3-type cytochrome oxidase maturation protein